MSLRWVWRLWVADVLLALLAELSKTSSESYIELKRRLEEIKGRVEGE